jgi:phosphatidylglycerophosphate synthase
MAGRSIELGIVTFLTVARFPLILVFFVCAIIHSRVDDVWLFIVAFTSLVASAVTDLFDGLLARRFNVETQFGAHADPLMDKFFYLTTLPLLIFIAMDNGDMQQALILLLMTLMFLTRDQWVTFLRSIGAIYQVSGGAHWAGKVRTAINFPLLGAIYLYLECPIQFIPTPLLIFAEIVALTVNAISAVTYTHHYWPYLKRSAHLHPDEKPET